MKRALVLVAAMLASCTVPPVHWPRVVHCLPVVTDLAEEVEKILYADGSHEAKLANCHRLELRELAALRGAGPVVCVIEQLVEGWTAQGEDPAQAAARAAAARGRSFLHDVGTQAQFDRPPPKRPPPRERRR